MPASESRRRGLAGTTLQGSSQGATRGHRALSSHTIRLLVVDDEGDVRQSVQDVVSALLPGVEVVQAGSALEALDCIRSPPPFAAVLTDFQMPGTNGMDLARAIHAENPLLPIVLMTAYQNLEGLDADAPETAPRRTIFAHLPKPFSAEQLMDVVRSALGQTHPVARQRPRKAARKAIRSRGASAKPAVV